MQALRLNHNIPQLNCAFCGNTCPPFSQDIIQEIDRTTDKGDISAVVRHFPEFRKTIGRKQSGVHAFTLDVHMQKALQVTLNDPVYIGLPPEDKKIAKYAALFHDIEKKEGKPDPEHPENSAKTVYTMMKKLNMPEKDAQRVAHFVRHHHWAKKIYDRKMNYQEAARIFEKPGDLEIAIILAKADIKASGSVFSWWFLENMDYYTAKIKNESRQRF